MEPQFDPIIAKLKGFLEESFPNPGVELTAQTVLLDEWFIDSLAIIELMLFIEREFGIEVTRADINGTNMKDLTTLARFVVDRKRS